MFATMGKVVLDFIETVGEATLTSLRATIYLPRTMAVAIQEYRESQKLDAEMEAALIDPTYLDRVALGVTPAESRKIKKLAKELTSKN